MELSDTVRLVGTAAVPLLWLCTASMRDLMGAAVTVAIMVAALNPQAWPIWARRIPQRKRRVAVPVAELRKQAALRGLELDRVCGQGSVQSVLAQPGGRLVVEAAHFYGQAVFMAGLTDPNGRFADVQFCVTESRHDAMLLRQIELAFTDTHNGARYRARHRPGEFAVALLCWSATTQSFECPVPLSLSVWSDTSVGHGFVCSGFDQAQVVSRITQLETAGVVEPVEFVSCQTLAVTAGSEGRLFVHRGFILELAVPEAGAHLLVLFTPVGRRVAVLRTDARVERPEVWLRRLHGGWLAEPDFAAVVRQGVLSPELTGRDVLGPAFSVSPRFKARMPLFSDQDPLRDHAGLATFAQCTLIASAALPTGRGTAALK